MNAAKKPRVVTTVTGVPHEAIERSAAQIEGYAVKVYFEATPDEFEDLEEKITDAIVAAMGCTDDPEHECPHFRFAFASPRGGRRRWALRCAFGSLWAAIRYGEVA